jgi:hypothetical protein
VVIRPVVRWYDAQFRHINRLAEQFLATGDPVISVDTL